MNCRTMRVWIIYASVVSNNTLCKVLFVKSPSMAMNMILIAPQPSTHAMQFMNNQ